MFYESVNNEWGPFTVDCFATYHNTKLARLFSRFWNPDAQAVDAFAQECITSSPGHSDSVCAISLAILSWYRGSCVPMVALKPILAIIKDNIV